MLASSDESDLYTERLFALGLYTGTRIMYVWLEGREIVYEECDCIWLDRTKPPMDTIEKLVLTLLYFRIKIFRKEFEIAEIGNMKILNNLLYERMFILMTERNLKT
jgi:hypothetical protein